MKKIACKIRYNNQSTYINIRGYMISNDLVSLSYPNVEENTSGFIIFDMEGYEIADCSEFKYRWDVLENNPNKIYYTNSENNVQEKAFIHENLVEDVDPLNTEELTECVADLMYQVSLNQLGM